MPSASATAARVALDDISFDVRREELFALLGPNGAGKTTLLHILCTILQPDSGTVHIGELDVIAQPDAGAPRRRRGVSGAEPRRPPDRVRKSELSRPGLWRSAQAAAAADRGDARAGGTDGVAGAAGAHIVVGHEAPRRDRPRADPRLAHPVPRRTDRRARRAVARADLAVCRAPAQPARADRRRHHALHRGGRGVRSGLRHRPRQDPRDRHAGRAEGSRTASSSCGWCRARTRPRPRSWPPIPTRPSGATPRSSSNRAATHSRKRSCRATAAASVACRSRSRAWKAFFSSLTGREIRDQAAGARERTLAFGRQGGEHTR